MKSFTKHRIAKMKRNCQWPIKGTGGFSRLVMGGLFMMLSMFSSANNIQPDTSKTFGVSITNPTSGSFQLLKISPANASGVSVNHFYSFTAQKPLKLVNVANSQLGFSAAKLIVIVAPSISLQNEVDVLGIAADVLFISTASNGSISCSSCVFRNVNRLTLAVANTPNALNGSTSLIGELTSVPGTISINGLSAPGLLSLEILANNIVLNNVIDTHARANSDIAGGYTLAENGSLTIGTSSVNLYHGNLKWNYDSRSVVKSTTQNRTVATELGGSIRAVGVSITSSDSLKISTSINTTTDLRSSVIYKNELRAVPEGINIQSFTPGAPYGSITLNSAMRSAGNVFVSASGNLTTSSASSLEGVTVSLLAKGRVEQYGRLIADNIRLATEKTLVNRGDVEASINMQIYAIDHIFNEFGGRLVGNEIEIQTENGFMRNGSRTPYIPNESEVNQFLTFSKADLDPSHKSNIGTFYREGMNVTTNYQRPMAADNGATIFAKTLSIKTKAFENINPYWEFIEEVGPLTLQKKYTNQVTVSGTDRLNIIADNYLLNSSAVIRLNSPSGLMHLRSHIVINERYRTMLALDQLPISTVSPIYVPWGVTSTTETYITRAYTYSPPGLLVSMNALAMDLGMGFINDTSYTEIFGPSQFMPIPGTVLIDPANTWLIDNYKKNGIYYLTGIIIHDVGVANGGISNNQTATTSLVACKGWPYTLCTATSESETIEILNPSELDSLFYVHGDKYGASVEFAVLQHKPFENVKALAANLTLDYTDILGRNVGDVYAHGTIIATDEWSWLVGDHTWANVLQGDTEIVGNTIILKTWIAKENTYLENHCFFTCYTVGQTVLAPLVAEGEWGYVDPKYAETTFSLFEFIQKIWQMLKDSINSIFNEINWWNA